MGSPDLERSNLIRIIRKTRNVFKNLRFCGKRIINKYIETLTFTRLQTCCSQIVTFDILNSSPGFGVDRHFYMVSLFSHELGFFRECKTSSANPVHSPVRPISFQLTESLGLLLKRGGVYLLVVFSLERAPGDHQMW